MKKYIKLLTLVIIIFTNAIPVKAEKELVVTNILENIPYKTEGMGKRKLVDEKDLLMMQAALAPGQNVPQHNANSNVHLLVITGEVMVNLGGSESKIKEGDLLAVKNGTPMNIKNISKENAAFLIIKTPNPSEMI